MSNALRRLTGTDAAHSQSAITNARRLPRTRPHAVKSSSTPASIVNVRLVSSTSVGTMNAQRSNNSGACDRNAGSDPPIAATASDNTTRRPRIGLSSAAACARRYPPGSRS
jgi:hypothetical protein